MWQDPPGDACRAPDRLAAAGQACGPALRCARVLGTSGNFSAVLDRDPLRLAITASGLPRGISPPSRFSRSMPIARLRAPEPAGRQPKPGSTSRLSGGRRASHALDVEHVALRPARGGARCRHRGLRDARRARGCRELTSTRSGSPVLENDQDMAAAGRRGAPNARSAHPPRHRLPPPAPRVVHSRRHASAGRAATLTSSSSRSRPLPETDRLQLDDERLHAASDTRGGLKACASRGDS